MAKHPAQAYHEKMKKLQAKKNKQRKNIQKSNREQQAHTMQTQQVNIDISAITGDTNPTNTAPHLKKDTTQTPHIRPPAKTSAQSAWTSQLSTQTTVCKLWAPVPHTGEEQASTPTSSSAQDVYSRLQQQIAGSSCATILEGRSNDQQSVSLSKLPTDLRPSWIPTNLRVPQRYAAPTSDKAWAKQSTLRSNTGCSLDSCTDGERNDSCTNATQVDTPTQKKQEAEYAEFLRSINGE